ncbi:MAG TPA: hypothetical protein VFW19_16905 [Allosphingosinicella sp.]|nr:hypothetical protein [Allosphingosinicella sp.]
MRPSIVLLLAFGLGGCIAKTAVDVVTLPVRATAAGVRAVTPDHKKEDEKRGRALRKRDECMGREARQAKKDGRDPDYSRCPDPDAGKR